MLARARKLLRPALAPVSLPRCILPGGLWTVNRRAMLRMFLLRPDAITNQIFMYCLAESAQRYGVHVLLASVQSNHHHTMVYDPDGKIIEFMTHLHKLVAKACNAHRGRWENFFSAEEPCLVQIFDPRDLLDKLVYVATNPVKDGLVETVAEW